MEYCIRNNILTMEEKNCTNCGVIIDYEIMIETYYIDTEGDYYCCYECAKTSNDYKETEETEER